MDLARNRVEEEFAIGRKTDKYLIIVFAWGGCRIAGGFRKPKYRLNCIIELSCNYKTNLTTDY